METPSESGPYQTLFVFLAGLEAGMLGALAMLAWLGVTAMLLRRTFWMPANLMASVFYGSSAIINAFGRWTPSGVALYLVVYSLLGALFALAVQNRLPRFRLTLVSVLFAVCWYYLSFHVVWPAVAPLLARLHVEGTTLWGHVIYGAMLGQYPACLSGGPEPKP